MAETHCIPIIDITRNSLDSEKVYKKFIIRHMAAARSFNVRLIKETLKKKREASANLKCPHSAPAKSSRPSSSLKMTDKNVQVKLSKVAATPNVKVRPSAPVAKALTTPRNNQKKVSNVEPFRSIQSGKKVLTVGVPKSRVVSSKALVFPSPKKVIKIKNSMELKTPMRALCSLPVKKNEEGGSKSSSLKMTDKNVQVKPLSKVAATPNGKVRPSAPVAKALTTPRNNQKKVSNVEPFRSVQSGKKVLTVGVPKSRVVSSKALVFPSPKKVIKIKSSMELKTPMRALCSLPVKKNEEGGSKSLPVTASKKQLRGREVKSRVFDFLSSNNRKEPETKSMSSLVKGGGTATRKHQNTDYYSSCDEKSRPKTQKNQSGGIQIDNSRCKVQRKVYATTPYRNDPRPKLEKPNDVNDKFKRKSEMTQRKVLRPLSALPRKKEKAGINCSYRTKVSPSTCAKGLQQQ